MTYREDIPELLAPAGSMAALRAAVSAGADAVYLGLDAFNARRSAENFTLETLKQALRFAHLRGVRVYLTMNVLILPREIESALRMIEDAWALGVDAVIIQDLGLLGLVRRLLPQVRVHASTQLNAHSTASVLELVEFGAHRVTLARELSFDEIAATARAAAATGAEVETFTHGALCMCYSGQCLMSSLIGGRSANRGQCAQPCRLPYELVDEAGAALSDAGSYLLSPKDLAAIQVLPSLIASGTRALKLEGRMKSPEYVALVTGVYRAALDRAKESPDAYEVREGEVSVLSEAFSRGFTEGYLVGERGNDMMSYTRPNNRGVLVGRIASPGQGNIALLELSAALDAEDTVEIWTSRGRFAQRVGDMESHGSVRRSSPAGARVNVSLDGPVSAGDRVFRVRNAALEAAAHRLFDDAQGTRIPLRFSVRVVTGEALAVDVEDAAGVHGVFAGETVEAARTRPVSAADISEHVGRLGGTPYAAESWDIELTPGAGISFSALHEARRRALSDYESKALSEWSSRAASHPRVPAVKPRKPTGRPVKLVAAVADLATAEACLEAGADVAHVPAWAVSQADRLPEAIVPLSPRICHDAEMDEMHRPCVAAGRAVAGTLGAVRLLAEKGVELEAHWSLNAVNEHSVAQIADAGCGFVWLSPELSLDQVAHVSARSTVGVGVSVAGRQELMVTEHCILMSEGECARACGQCARRRSVRFLKDRKGYRFPVTTDPLGRSHVYNSVALDVTHALDAVLEAGVSAIRIDLDIESTGRAVSKVRDVREMLDACLSGHKPRSDRSRGTTGHFFKGLS